MAGYKSAALRACQAGSFVFLRQLVGYLLVQDLADGEGYYRLVFFHEESLDLGQGVFCEGEGDEEALGPAGPVHRRLERVYVRPAGAVLLLDLDGIPCVHKVQSRLPSFQYSNASTLHA